MSSKLWQNSLSRLNELLEAGEITAVDLVESVVKRYERIENTVNAFESFDPRAAMERAEKLEADSRSTELAGIPLAVKDNLCREGRETSCSSRILEGHEPPYTATVVEKLQEAGGIIMGNTNMDEFAMGSSTENSAHATTRNPRDPERVPGGSSGGSAAAVASGLVPGALGTDTGGSVRQPASLCGVVGVKPTYGRVSRYGLIAFASSLDQVGPLARNVEDAALLTEIISGKDPRDSTSLDEPVPAYSEKLSPEPGDLVLGIPEEYFGEGVQPGVEAALEDVMDELESTGVELKEISLPHTEYAISTYYIIATAEASSNLARYDGVQYGPRAEDFEDLVDLYSQTRAEGFGEEVKRRIMLGTFVLSSGYYEAYYGKAQKVRTLIKQDFEDAYEKCDLLLTPTSPSTAFKLGEKTDDPVQMYLSDILTTSANLAGLPAISLPVDSDSDGLPVGAQLIGPTLSEQKLFDTAALVEELSPWEPVAANNLD